MTSSYSQLERPRHRLFRTRLVGALILAALLPGVFGVALLISAWLRRPLLAGVLNPREEPKAASMTIAWGIALLAIAALQLAVGLAGFGSIASPTGLAVRTGFALVAETVLVGVSIGYLTWSAQAAKASVS
jgi:hypothetical protein